MTEVAAEVGDGYFLHPFNTERSTDELSLAAIDRGLAKAGKSRDDFSVAAQVITATGLDEKTMQESIFGARSQIGFYASTPAYLPVLECHGWGDVHVEAKRLSKEGKWMEMAQLIDDDIAHGLGGSGEEVTAVAPSGITRTNQLHIRFVHEGRRLQGVALGLALEVAAGERA